MSNEELVAQVEAALDGNKCGNEEIIFGYIKNLRK